MESEEDFALLDYTVVVTDNKIAALGPSDQIEVPPGATKIDGSGKFLLPGFFDTHVHVMPSEDDRHLALYLANGVTTVQSMNGTPKILETRDRLASGELFGPRMITTGPTTGTERVASPQHAREYVRVQKKAGYDAIKMYGDGSRTMSAETYQAVIDTAHELGMRVVGHSLRNHPFELVLNGGQDSIDHMEEIVYADTGVLKVLGPLIDSRSGGMSEGAEDRQVPGNFNSIRARLEPEVQALAARVRAADLAVSPTLIAFETIWRQTTPKYPNLLKANELQYMSPRIRLSWGPALNRYRTGGWRDILDTMDTNLRRSIKTQIFMVKRFNDAGVRLMVGTDSPLTFVYPGFAVHRELELFVKAGLTPYQALRAATAVPAEELNLTDAGTVAQGQRADLILLSTDPRTNIRNTRRIVGVAANGRWLPRGTLDRRLDELAAVYAPQAKFIKKLADAYDTNDPAEIIAAYLSRGKNGESVKGLVEDSINAMGYQRLGDGEIDAAIAIFRLNTDAFPEAANTWDSLAEAIMTQGDHTMAIAYYRKSLVLNPGNGNAEQMIERMQTEL
jgi:imidazolonepropionase-like amidohydrolase